MNKHVDFDAYGGLDMDNQISIEIQKFKQGNFHDYEVFYNLTCKYIYKLITDIVPDTNVASQLMTSTYNQIYQSINTLVDDSQFFVWAGRIATDVSVTYINSTSSLSYECYQVGEYYPYRSIFEDYDAFIPENILNDLEIQRIVQNCIDDMPVMCKIIIQYFYYEQMPINEIAIKLNLTEEQVRNTVGYIKESFKVIINNTSGSSNIKMYSLAQVPIFWIAFKNVVDYATIGAIGGAITGSAVGGAVAGQATVGGVTLTGVGQTTAGGALIAGSGTTTGVVAGATGTGIFATIGGKIAIAIAATATIAVGGVAIHNVITEDEIITEQMIEDDDIEDESTPINVTADDITETVEENDTIETVEEIVYGDANYKIGYNYQSEFGDYFSGIYREIIVEGEEYQSLIDALNEWNTNNMYIYESESDFYASSATSENSVQYMFETNVIRADGRVLSIEAVKKSFQGDMHGKYSVSCINFDVCTGEIISLDDLGDIKSDIKMYVLDYIQTNSLEVNLLEDYEAKLDDLLDSGLNWSFSGEELRISFSEGELGLGNASNFNVYIPYNMLEHFNTKYIGGMENSYTIMTESEKHYIDLNNDGVNEEVIAGPSYGYAYGFESYIDGFFVSINGEVHEQELGWRCLPHGQVYICNTKDEGYIIIFKLNDIDNYDQINVYRLTEAGVEYICEENKQTINYLIGNYTYFATRVDLLGTYFYSMKMEVTASGFNLIDDGNVDGWYFFDNQKDIEKRSGPTTTQIVEAKILSADGTFIDYQLPVGTTIYPVSSNLTSTIGFFMEDGTYGELSFEIIDGHTCINGIQESELFENIPYFQ